MESNVDEITNENIRTAYHEAGHVVAYIEYGLEFDYVSIIPEQTDEGLFRGAVRRETPSYRTFSPSVKETDLLCSRVINAFYAGPMTAAIFTRATLTIEDGCTGDMSSIHDVMKTYARCKKEFRDEQNWDRYLEVRAKETAVFILSHTRLIHTIAKALLLKRKLLHNEVIELYSAWKDEEKALARLNDLHPWKTKKIKGGKTYYYWMASWREGDKVRNVHLGSCKKMDAEAAMQKARAIKAKALGFEILEK